MKRRWIQTLSAVAVSCAALHGEAQVARDPELARALAQIRNGDPEAALLTLDPLLRRWSPGGGELATAYLGQGIAQAMLNSEPTARGAFREALRLDPSLTLAPADWPPSVLRTWNEARAAAGLGAASAAAPPAAPQATVAPQASAPVPPPTRPGLPIHAEDADVNALLARIEATMRAGDATALQAAIDADAVVEAGMAGLPGPPELAARFRSQAVGWVGGVQGLAEDLRRTGDAFRLLRTRTASQGRLEAVFRRSAPSGAANYFVYALGRRDAGPRVVDLLSLSFGEWESETARRRWRTALHAARGAPDPDAELIRHAAEIDQTRQFQAAGQAAAALETLGKLPASLQVHRDILLWRAVLAQSLGPGPLLEAARAFESRFPGDPALDMIAIDAEAAMGRHDRALAAVERVAARVGGDAYLDVMAAEVLRTKGDYKAARARAARAASAEPRLSTPWLSLLAISVGERDHAETAWALRVLETRFNEPIPDLAALPHYAEFVRSPEHAAWARTRGQPAAAVPPPPPPPAVTTPVRVGGQIPEPRKRVDAPVVYPEIAKAARVQGIVILECTISPAGEVIEARVLHGNPLLDQAAIDAVRKWRYAPTLLNGVPVPVLMTVTVNFKLGGGEGTEPQVGANKVHLRSVSASEAEKEIADKEIADAPAEAVFSTRCGQGPPREPGRPTSG